MAVVRVGLEDTLGGAFKELGGGVSQFLEQVVFQKQNREAELSRDPAMMQSLLPGVLAAQASGPEALQAMADGLNVRPEFLDKVAAFPETREQQEARIFMTEGGPKAVVGAEIAGAEAAIETAAVERRTAIAALNLNLPEQLAADTLINAQLSTEEAKAALDEGLPRLQAIAETSEANLSIAQVESILGTPGLLDAQAKAALTEANFSAADWTALLEENVHGIEARERAAAGKLNIEQAETIMDLNLIPAQVRADLATAELTIAEWTEISSSGLIPERVRAQLGEAQVSTEVSAATLREGLPAIEARAERLRLIGLERELTEQQILGFPEIKARADVSVMTAEAAEAVYREDLIVRQTIAGVPQLTVDAQVLTAQAQMADADLSLEAATGIKNYIDTLDLTNPAHAKIQRELFMGLSNPAYLQVLAQREGRDIETSLRLASLTQQGEADKFSTTLQLEDRIAEAIVALGEATGDEQVEAAKVRVENLRKIAADMMLTGRIMPIDLIGATGKPGKYEFFFDEVESENVKVFLGIAGTLIEAGENPEEVLAQALANAAIIDPDTGLPGLTQREIEELTEKFPDVIETVEAAAQIIDRLQGEAGRPSPVSEVSRNSIERRRQNKISEANQIISETQNELAQLVASGQYLPGNVNFLNAQIAKAQKTLDKYAQPLNTLSYEQLQAFLGIDANTFIARTNAAYPPLEEPR